MAPSAPVPPHAPVTGWARRILGDLHVTGLHWYRLHLWAARTIPPFLLPPLIVLFTTAFFCTIFNIRRAVASNLEAVLGPCGWPARQRRIYRTFLQFAWCATERYEHLATDRPFEVATEGTEHWEAVTASGRGFVVITAHLGLYEVGSMVPAARKIRRVHLVREPEVDPRAQELIRRSVAGVEGENYRMHFQSDDPLQGLELLEALRRGEIVAMQADRPRTGGRTVRATLFGRPTELPAGPAALARAAGVPLLPAFAVREGRRRYRLVFRPPIDVVEPSDRDTAVEAAMRHAASDIEAGVRRAPHQWFVFRELWPA